jgi:hypothetical protein
VLARELLSKLLLYHLWHQQVWLVYQGRKHISNAP